MEKKDPHQLILETIKNKAVLKQQVYRNTKEVFKDFKEVMKGLYTEMKQTISKENPEVSIEYKDGGEFEARLKIGGDILIFYMHTNVFDFPQHHHIHNTSYVKEDQSRSFCGKINVYNFLADSFKYNRINDLGYLVARIFINKDGHFFVEGKRQLGFLYNDFVNAKIDKDSVKSITESAILYCLDFDLLAPPYDEVKLVSVSEMHEVSSKLKLKTGKRLGFKFQADDDLV